MYDDTQEYAVKKSIIIVSVTMTYGWVRQPNRRTEKAVSDPCIVKRILQWNETPNSIIVYNILWSTSGFLCEEAIQQAFRT
jgi:hypothetical protein